MNDKDHLVGQLTRAAAANLGCEDPSASGGKVQVLRGLARCHPAMPIMLLTAHSASQEEYTGWWVGTLSSCSNTTFFCPPPNPLLRKTQFCLYFTITSDMALPVREGGYFSWLFKERVTIWPIPMLQPPAIGHSIGQYLVLVSAIPRSCLQIAQ